MKWSQFLNTNSHFLSQKHFALSKLGSYLIINKMKHPSIQILNIFPFYCKKSDINKDK